MHRHLLLAASATWIAAGFSAHAQPAAPADMPPAQTSPGAATSPGEIPREGAPPAAAPPAATAPSAALHPGMPVTDTTGAPVGTISQVGQTSDGRAAAVIDVDGQQVGLLASNLSPSPGGDHAVSSLSKAQLLASVAAHNAARPG